MADKISLRQTILMFKVLLMLMKEQWRQNEHYQRLLCQNRSAIL